MTHSLSFDVVSRWWRAKVVGSVDHIDVNERVHEDAGSSFRYLFMVTLSAGIAVLGLLLSSPAVVIGAMLISPLMGPIIGLGFALATVDAQQIRRAAFALVAGTVLSILFCAALVLISPLQNITTEIAARTRPNLFDLVVALFSALAGSYATIRGRAGTIVGVAIATALMPPLATVGFGLATWNGTVFFGSLFLFVTNFVTIALTAAVMARFYGFGPRLSPHQTLLQSVAILATLAALAVPLGLSLRRIAWEGIAGRQAREALTQVFGDNARFNQLDLDFNTSPITVKATVLTPHYQAQADKKAAAAFLKLSGQPATMTLEQYRVGMGSADAEAAAIAAAQTRAGAPAAAAAAADALAQNIAGRLALVAGVDPSQVTLDRDNKRARVAATMLPGATLGAYHLLEMRVAAAAPGWSIDLVPPAVSPGTVTFSGSGDDITFDAAGRSAIAEATWAARRLGLGVAVSGPRARTAPVLAAFANVGVPASRAGGGRTVTLAWAVPPPVTPPNLAVEENRAVTVTAPHPAPSSPAPSSPAPSPAPPQ